MSGAEIPIAKAAKAAAKAAKNDPQTTDALLELAKESPHFRSAADSVAKRQAVKQALILKFWQPLGRFAGASSDYFNSEFPTDLGDKMKDVPDEEIQTPKPSVAMPALEALAYSVDEAELKEMYLNLLARASDKRSAPEVHPAYSQIIRQLDVSEIELLSVILSQEIVPTVFVTVKKNGQDGQHHMTRHLMNTYREGAPWVVPEAESWINNWVRLGLVETDYANFLTDPRAYSWVEDRPEMVAARRSAGADVVSFEKGYARRTAFGKRFAAVVTPGPTSGVVRLVAGPRHVETDPGAPTA